MVIKPIGLLHPSCPIAARAPWVARSRFPLMHIVIGRSVTIGLLQPSHSIGACALWVFRGGRTHRMGVGTIAVCLLLIGAVHAIGCLG